ncbi:hypothetical protein N7474_007855 [Penicillium riverlandense]|uniref:uncharacterized protein n=1 Tax=Penicillium riverlandense TaxID=1903569 RepID=UPI002547360B|nr:uncharacterized protein N7474_007855 [Penicillium riverlandense]KAJ5811554.1 hypothetical protein N7474_007855 [Penicillium riverlandense]
MSCRSRSNSYTCTSPVTMPRLRKNSEDSLRLSHIRTLASLRVSVSKTIVDRLSTNGLDPTAMGAETISPCLPIDSDWESWEQVLNNPLGVSDLTLSKILGLRSTGSAFPLSNSKSWVKEDHILYIRSFLLKANELRAIIMKFHENGIETGTTLSWLDYINGIRPEQRVYIRYVGKSNRSAALRFREDILLRQRGFIAKFVQALGDLFPQSLDSASVYELQGSYAPKLAEHIERVLIVLLGFPSLLNQRLWPINLFRPSVAHANAFRKLGTRTIARLKPSEFHPSPNFLSLETWGEKVQAYAEAHQLSVCVWRNKVYPFSNALRRTIIEQGRPSTFQGKFVLFLVIGERIPALDYREATGFFSSPCNSSDLLKGFLTRLWSWEEGQPMTPSQNDICRLIAAGAIPFVDLCPWIKAEGTHLLEASHLLREYTSSVKPMIVISIATRSSSVVASGFSHAFGYPQSCKFRDKVGRLNLVHCGSEFCCLQIPCFHPGQARFSANPETFAKVLDMTLWVLLLTISVTLDSAATFEERTREDWCIYIKNTVEQRLRNENFYSSYDQLKAKLQDERPKWCSTGLISRDRYHLAVASRPVKDRLLLVGFAVDEPSLSRRRQQVWTLWHLNIPELHSHISRERKDEWFSWANDLENGTSFLAHAIVSAVLDSNSTSPPCALSGNQQVSLFTAGRPRKRQKILQELNKVAENFGYSGILNVSTNSDLVPSSIVGFLEALSLESSGPISHHEAVKRVTAELSVALLPSQLLDACKLLEEEWDIGRADRFKAEYQQSWSGAPVAIWKNFKFAIFWESPDGQKFKFVLCPPASTCRAPFSKGKCIFLCVTFYSWNNEDLGSQLVRMWEHETGLTWSSIIAEQLKRAAAMKGSSTNVSAIPGSFFSGPSKSLLSSHLSTAKSQLYQGNPQPSDALWLLQMCVYQHWPKGGTVFIGDPDKFTWRDDNFWVQLWKSLASGKYSNHPRIDEVSAWALDLSNSWKTQQVIANLKCFCRIRNQKKIQVRDYERIRKEKKDVKVVGTEVEIVYDLVA